MSGCLFPCGIQLRPRPGEIKADPGTDTIKHMPEIRRSLTPLGFPEPEPPTGWRRLLRRSKVQRTLDQHQSPLAGLPPEIRWMIWTYYFCVHQIHVVRIDRGHSRALDTRLAAIKCADGHADNGDSFCNHLCWEKVPRTRTFHDALSPIKPQLDLESTQGSNMEEVSFVALLQTCRLM
ncbi:hypothetical protein N7493_008064 [Penicillium malachiteum]|uniref:DUF7730 domain-containing protein n=1 Tax=Penicillium malachiteum TaxID=1324776 RepID=A0AAD6HGF4_9EURO|nr:hypothetical protein N7493_008064 [Penicillium malachiteum]